MTCGAASTRFGLGSLVMVMRDLRQRLSITWGQAVSPDRRFFIWPGMHLILLFQAARSCRAKVGDSA